MGCTGGGGKVHGCFKVRKTTSNRPFYHWKRVLPNRALAMCTTLLDDLTTSIRTFKLEHYYKDPRGTYSEALRALDEFKRQVIITVDNSLPLVLPANFEYKAMRLSFDKLLCVVLPRLAFYADQLPLFEVDPRVVENVVKAFVAVHNLICHTTSLFGYTHDQELIQFHMSLLANCSRGLMDVPNNALLFNAITGPVAFRTSFIHRLNNRESRLYNEWTHLFYLTLETTLAAHVFEKLATLFRNSTAGEIKAVLQNMTIRVVDLLRFDVMSGFNNTVYITRDIFYCYESPARKKARFIGLLYHAGFHLAFVQNQQNFLAIADPLLLRGRDGTVESSYPYAGEQYLWGDYRTVYDSLECADIVVDLTRWYTKRPLFEGRRGMTILQQLPYPNCSGLCYLKYEHLT
jgi:hypothetical protein